MLIYAWASHQLVIGGAVRGGDFYGVDTPNRTPYPVLYMGRNNPALAVHGDAVTHEPVLAGHPACGECRDRGCCGRREHRANHVAPRHPGCEEAGVPGAGLDVGRAESIDEYDDGTGCPGQFELVRLTPEARDRTAEYPGKPRSCDGRHR